MSSEVGTQVEAPVSGLSTALETNGELAGSLWTVEAERELKKIPFFVRGKARRNTEAFAAADGRRQIDLDTLYDAKAHYAR